MSASAEIRTIYTARQYHKVLSELLNALNSLLEHKLTKELLDDYSFAYNRDGKIEAVKGLGKNPLIKWPMSMFFEYVDLTDTVLAISVKLDKVMEFTETLIIDSQYDFELADSYFVPKNDMSNRGTPFSVSDEFIDEINEYDIWISRYAAVRNEVDNLCNRLYNVMPMIDVFKGVLKDSILSEYYDIHGYLPERLEWYKDMADNTFNGSDNGTDGNGLKTREIDTLPEKFREAYFTARLIFLNFFRDKEHLFAESYADEYARYAISVYHSNFYWTS